MFQLRAKIVYNKRVKDKYFRLTIKVPEISREAVAGQFLNLRVRDATEPLLRRPFSIHRTGPKGGIEILYEVIGKGSQLLSRKKAGELLDVIGPLGNGFHYKSQGRKVIPKGAECRRNYRLAPGTTSQVLVAGGMGVAPLIFLAEKLKEVKSQKAKVKNIVLIGARTKKQILCEKEFKELGFDVKIATDDGSTGFHGKVTGLLESLLSTIDHRRSTIYACGPKPMLREISRIAVRHKIPAQISLEAHMACGIGACLGCVVKTKEGYKRVCKEGPVLSAQDIIWQEKGVE
jgi:dihydroorotate dehydrogenase electron transfer subunit